jgi:hypothetical protein
VTIDVPEQQSKPTPYAWMVCAIAVPFLYNAKPYTTEYSAGVIVLVLGLLASLNWTYRWYQLRHSLLIICSIVPLAFGALLALYP